MGKKRKVKNKELTQEEIWDDSALIQSWDDAVEEYKLYHSIHARGENVDDVLREAAAGKPESRDEESDRQEAYPAGDSNAGFTGEGESEDGEVQEDEYTPMDTYPPGIAQPHAVEDTSSRAQPQEGRNDKTSAMKETTKEGMNMPQALLGAKDESLKNLMMAWYYAGYYTGLHEGQQQANQQRSS